MEAATGGAGTGGATTGGGGVAAASFVFKDPSVYDKLEVSEDEKGFPIVELPVGTKVFRADRPVATAPSTDVPAFFGNLESIKPYTKWRPGLLNRNKKEIKEADMGETLSAYTVTKSPRLFHMSFVSLTNLQDYLEYLISLDIIKGKQKEFLQEAIHILSIYIQPFSKDISFVIPFIVFKPPSYMNRMIANILCALGYDGWIVKPFVGEEQGLKQLSSTLLYNTLKEKEKVDKLLDTLTGNAKIGKDDLIVLATSIIPYTPEIMLCKWDKFMVPATLEGGGRRRAKTRRHRQRHRRRRTHRN